MVKLRLLVLLALLALGVGVPFTSPAFAQSQIYYVSSSNPAAADTNPGTQSQPWRTPARVQQAVATLRPGDQVLFERGGTYTGSLNISGLSGTASNSIVFGAYGSGAEPIISGLVTLTNWAALGGNRYEATCSDCGTSINHLLIDGQTQRIARYPNMDEGDEGYLYYDSFTGSTSITDDALAGQNWVGGEMVVRTIAWILDRLPITSHVGGTLTSTTQATYEFTPGWGYFIQNHPAALDRDGEWIYNPTTGKVTLYSTSNPASGRIQVTTIDTLWRMNNVSHITLRDLVLHGGDERTLEIGTCTTVKLENVQLLYGGSDALRANNCTELEIGNSRAAYALGFGLRIYGCQNCRIHHSIIEQIAMFAGMGKNGNEQYNGVVLNGSGSVFEYNTVRYVGYLGVRVEGANIIRYNVVSYFNRVKVDGGGIYCFRTSGSSIIGNIVLHGEGSKAGIPWGGTATHGIYIDDNSENIMVRDNSIGYVSESGIYLHNTRNVAVVNNTIFGVDEYGILLGDDNLGTYNVEGSLIENNQIFQLDGDAAGMRVSSSLSGASFLQGLGTLRNNAWCNPTTDINVRLRYQPNGTNYDNALSLPQWQALSGHDTGSTECALTYPQYVETGTAGSNQIANSTLDSNINGWIRWPEANGALAHDTRMGGSLRFTHLAGDSVIGYHPIGAVTGGQVHRVRFRGVTDAVGTSVTVNIQQHGPDYGWLTPPQNVVLTTTERDVLLYLIPSRSYASARLNFILPAGASPVWLDNIEVATVTAAPLRYEDVARFEVNATNSARSFTLDQAYSDPRGNRHTAGSSITLQPFTSIILLRDVPVTTAALNGRLTVQGRSSTPPLNVTMTQSGTQVYSGQVTPNASSEFQMTGLPVSALTVRLKHPQYLAVVQTITLPQAGTVDFGTLRAGDVNDDNRVTLVDFSIMVGAFNKRTGDTGFDQRADLNGDGAVTLLDFSLLSGNFNQVGQ